MKGLRQKEDPWNSIASGFLTSGVLAARSGPKVALTSAALGGVFLAVIEGLGIAISRLVADQNRPMSPQASLSISCYFAYMLVLFYFLFALGSFFVVFLGFRVFHCSFVANLFCWLLDFNWIVIAS